jgi:hypothetical protein
MRILSLSLLSLLTSTFANPTDTVSACATVLCPFEHECVVSNGKATCVPIGGGKCGPTICAKGLQCCNASCGVCTKPGMACTMQACVGPVCGRKVCAFGEKCCNESCGYCVKPGGGCTKELCL